jgi:hypothetical protein
MHRDLLAERDELVLLPVDSIPTITPILPRPSKTMLWT